MTKQNSASFDARSRPETWVFSSTAIVIGVAFTEPEEESTVDGQKQSSAVFAPIHTSRACVTLTKCVGMNSDLQGCREARVARSISRADLQGCREARVAGASHGPTYKDVGKPVLQEHLTGRPTRACASRKRMRRRAPRRR